MMHHGDDSSLSIFLRQGALDERLDLEGGRVDLAHGLSCEMISWCQMKVDAEKAPRRHNIDGQVSSHAV